MVLAITPNSFYWLYINIPTIWDPFNISTVSLSIKVQKRNGIARWKWTKINVHFSKALGDFVQMVLRKTRCEHNAAVCIFVDFSWLHTFLRILWVMWVMGFYVVRTIQPLCNAPCPSHNMGHYYYIYFITLYKSPEKKWHRSVKMDKNKCPFFKRARGVCANCPSDKRVVCIML